MKSMKLSAVLLMAFGAIQAFATTYYVSHSGADDDSHGTEAAPFKTIAYAVGKAAAGDEIVVEKSETVYRADDLVVAKAVTIRSSTGIPEDVIVTRSADKNVRVFRLNHSGAVLRGLTITGGRNWNGVNDGSKGGANVYIDSNGGVVENCIIRNAEGGDTSKDAQSCAGGAGVLINSAYGRVSNCVITNNLAGCFTNYGAVRLMAAGLVENCFIAYNRCCSGRIGVNMKGAGVYADVSGAKVINCTIYANEAAGYAGVYLGNPFALFQNCLIWGNKGCAGSTGYDDIVGGNFNSSTFRNCAARTSEIKDNQSNFIALSSLPAVGGQLKPVAGSPLNGAGAVHASAVSTVDLAGNPRVVGDKIDIGCFQYQGTEKSIGMTISQRAFRMSQNLEITFTAKVDNGTVDSYEWDFGDGTAKVTTAEPTVTHNYAKVGKFSPSVTAAGVTYTAKDEIRSLPDTMYVVADNAGEEYPYDTKAKAAKLPQTAIEAAEVDGLEVVIADGNYVSTETPIIKTGITVRGESGTQTGVTIRGGSSSTSNVRGPYINHANARLSSVKLMYGRENANYGNDAEGVGLAIAAGGGTVSNCYITSVQPSGLQYSAVVVQSAKGLITHSYATANTTGETNEIGIFKLTNGRLENCVITENTKSTSKHAKKGAAVIVNGDNAVVRNCTIVNNNMATCGGAIVYKGVVRNCVFSGNNAQLKDNAKNYWTEHAERFDHCATDDAAAINATCVIGTAATFYESGKYVPLAGGPLFNAGVNPDPCEATDYAGNKRISGGTIDIGAYEADGETFGFEILSDATQALVPATVHYSAGLSGTNGTDVFRCYWSFDGGATYEEAENAIAKTYTGLGTNAVSCIVSNLTTVTGLGKTKDNAVVTLPKTMYVVADNPTAAWPYESWEHAATKLDTAVATTIDGGEIVLSNGLHQTSSDGLTFNKAITVRGVTGRPEDVTIQAVNEAYHVCSYAYTLDNADVVLRDLVIASKPGNGCCAMKIATAGGTVSNCVITSGMANDHWIMGGAVYMSSAKALVTHCVITNNTVTYAGTGKGVVYDDGGGRISNCLIVKNKIQKFESGYPTSIAIVKSLGLVDNCTIVSNDSATVQYPLLTFSDTVLDTPHVGHAYNSLVAANTGYTNTVANAAVSGNLHYCLRDAATPAGDHGQVATADALFVDPAAGDWHLRSTALGLAINRGVNDFGAALPSVDLDGNPRKVGPRVDIGCYESPIQPGMLLLVK